MATNLADMNLETLAHVSELGVPENPAAPVPKDVNGENSPDHFVQGLNVNDSAPEGSEVTLRNEVVVQNETGLETISSGGAVIDLSKPTGNDISLGVDIEYSHVDDGSGEDDKDDGLPEAQKLSYSEESNSCEAAKPGECDVGESDALEDFRDALEEMDAEVGYPDSVDYMEEREYSVGDLVWGKIRSHPWWPGQIYAPDDASNDALKYNQKGRHLVAYYGDGSFSWCLPSQLIPFAEHFEEMSAQSSSKAFVRAVQQAVDEIGRLVELETTCSCVPDGNRKGLTRPLVVNAGIRSGVLVPEGDIGKLLSFRYDPSEVLVTVASIANSVSFASTLELSILKGWLSAFYRARGGFTLPLYYEPLFVMGLDGSGQTNVEEQNDFSIPIEVPLQDPLKEGLVSPATAGEHVYQGDGNYHRRKQKSETELTKETDVIPKGRKRDTSGEGSDASDIVNRKRKSDNSVQVSATGMRQDRKEKDEILNPDIGVLRKEEMQNRSLSSELNKADIPRGERSNGEGAKGYEEMSSIRQRRKSKYLSPPFTIPTSRSGYPSYGQAAESEEKSKFARVGERIKAAAEQLFESSPSINRVGTTSKKTSKRRGVNQACISADLLPQSGPQYQNKIIEAVDGVASGNEVLSGLLSVASSPLGPWNAEMLKLTRDFFSAFRSSITPDEAIYNLCNKRKRKRERNSLNLQDGDLVNNLNQTGSSGARKRKEKLSSSKISTAEKSYTPKRKKAARLSAKEANSVGLENNASLTSSLVLTIPPGFSLPSKDEIINTFSKYGHVSEEETVVFSNSCRVKIEHVNSAGAETALRELLRQNPFGSATVDFKICYSSAAPTPAAVASDSAAPTAVASDLASDGMPHLGSNAQT